MVVVPYRSRTAAGLGFGLASAGSFGLAGPLARGLMDAGWSAGAAVTVRLLLAAVVLLPPAVVVLRERLGVVRAHLRELAPYGLVGIAGCQFCYFNAVQHMEVAVALLVEYTAPVAVVLWLWLRAGERPGARTVAGAVVAAAGLVLVLGLLHGAEVSLLGLLWASGAMVGAATYFVMSADRSNQLPPIALAAGGLLVGGLGLLAAGLVGAVPMSVSTADVGFVGRTVSWWVPLLALGVVTAALAYATGIAAGRRLGSRLASFVGLAEVLAALLFAWALLGEIPGPAQLVGGVLVVAGVVLVKLGEPRRSAGGAETAVSSEPV